MIQLSPGVSVREVDLTNVVPAVATSIGAAVIEAGWGPVMDVTTVDSENTLVGRFGRPNDLNAANWMAAANFLSYSNNLLVVRSDTTRQRNAVSTLTFSVDAVPVTSGGAGYLSTGIDAATVSISAPAAAGQVGTIPIANAGAGYGAAPTVVIPAPEVGGTQAIATAALGSGATAGQVVGITITNPGSGYLVAPTVTLTGGTPTTPATIGSVILTTGGIRATGTVAITGGVVTGIDITNPGSGYFSAPTVNLNGTNTTPAVLGTVTLVSGGIKINNIGAYTTSFDEGEAVVGEFAAKYPGSIGNSLRVSVADSSSFATWAYRGVFNSAPNTSTWASNNGSTNDELHIVVVDKDGKWSGVAGTVLEKFEFVSKASDARKEDGSGAYYKTVLSEQSNFIWWMDHPAVGTNWGQPATNIAYTSIGASAITRDLAGGVDHMTASDGQRIRAFDLFTNDEELDVNLIVVGKANTAVASWVIQNVAEARKDCVAFVSPQNVSSGEVLVGNTSDVAEAILTYRNGLPSSSYFMVDTGYKYQYDRYNDKYRWVPLNGDIAGLCARTDFTDDPWFSPAGMTRGQVKNVVKLAFSPRKTDRDNLYKSGVNPVVSFPGQGVVLYGDKTGLAKPSAFDRINVRRLFITLEKAIATAAKYQLFEINDAQTRAQFRSMVEPFLRDVKGRRGLYDFKVVCDESNNTAEVIDGNRFAASIFISPARSINFIELSFVATRTGGVAFSEIAGSSSNA